MKFDTPLENILIGTLYLLSIILIAYVAKLSFRSTPKSSKQQAKAAKAVRQREPHEFVNNKAYESIPKLEILIKSWLKKYTFVGSIVNTDKSYLLKEVTFISIFCGSCLVINALTLWPLALIIPFLPTTYFLFEYWRKDRLKCSQPANVANEDIEINEQMRCNQVKEQKNEEKNRKQIILNTFLAFLSVVLVSNTMFSIYNSMSNLGTLNIYSLTIIFLLDQFCVRLGITAVLSLTYGIAYLANKNPFQFNVFLYLSSQILVEQMAEIDMKKSEEESMGASPTRKKQTSPSKVPKVQQLYFENDTLINLQTTVRVDETLQQMKKKQGSQFDSPIRQIDEEESEIIFTTEEKKMFDEEEQKQNLANSIISKGSETRRKIPNANHFYSAQRPFKKNNEDRLEDNDLVLIQAQLNETKDVNKNKTEAYHTMDIDMSPLRKRKPRPPVQKNRRQLIVTGSSPYLEYLPDMMKKTGNEKKGKMSVPINNTVSRKIL